MHNGAISVSVRRDDRGNLGPCARLADRKSSITTVLCLPECNMVHAINAERKRQEAVRGGCGVGGG